MDIGVINALRDAGIAIAIGIISYGFLVAASNLIKTIIVSNNSVQDKRWDDMIKQDQENNKIRMAQLEALNNVNNTMNAGMDEIRDRFDKLDESVRLIRTDIEAIKIAIFNEAQAGG